MDLMGFERQGFPRSMLILHEIEKENELDYIIMPTVKIYLCGIMI